MVLYNVLINPSRAIYNTEMKQKTMLQVLVPIYNCAYKFIYAYGKEVGHKDPLSPGKG